MRFSTPMMPRILTCTITGLVLATAAARAQSYEQQARTILDLFESGRKDTAYALIEPLKKAAPLVPAVLYTRAQMTPDDRALPLYHELIALAPGGDYADDAAYQLVRRYVEKSDSLAAATWLRMLKTNYPRSPLVQQADRLVGTAFGGIRRDTTLRPSASTPQSTSHMAATTPPAAATPSTSRETSTRSGSTDAPSAPADESDADAMRGYALQVGLFPTRESAMVRAEELKANGIRAVPLPKTVDGQRSVALVVGPFTSIDAANARKSAVSDACDCQAFIVRVE